jgi:hypothetical protein
VEGGKDRRSRRERGRDEGVDGGGQRGISSSTREPAVAALARRDISGRRREIEWEQDTRWQLVGNIGLVLGAKRETT